jgi:hypothetical protein
MKTGKDERSLDKNSKQQNGTATLAGTTISYLFAITLLTLLPRNEDMGLRHK